jgi:hypothetical protein
MANLFSKLGPVFGGPAPTPSAAEVGLVDGDFNTIIVPGIYTISGSWINGPNGAASYTGVLEVQARSFNNGFWQILRVGTDTRRRYTNSSGGAAWNNAWERIENPTVGSVAQSGGIPTGAVIERGSNANGEYTKFADGTMICMCSVAGLPVSTATGSIFRSETFSLTFPASFANTASLSVVANAAITTIWCNTNGTSTGQTSLRAYASLSDATARNFNVLAIGRWF